MKTSDEEIIKMFKYTAKELKKFNQISLLSTGEIIRHLALIASTEKPQKACDMIFEYILMVILNQDDRRRRETLMLVAARCMELYGACSDVSFEEMTEQLRKVYDETK